MKAAVVDGARSRSRTALSTGWLLNLPALAVLAFFFLVPTAISVWFSLRDWDGTSDSKFIGLRNFAALGASPPFWHALWTNLLYAALTLVTQVPLAFVLAYVLFKQRTGTHFLRALVLFPQVISIGAAGLLWLMIYDPQRGLLNYALSGVLRERVAIAWLGAPETALISVVVATNWYYFGLHTLIFMAGMSGIPPDYYDVLKLNSARMADELRYIILPLLREQLLISFLLVMSGSFGQVLGFISLLTNGGPADSTELLGLYSIEIGFRAGRFGLASAVTVVLVTLVVSIVIWPLLRISKTRLEYT